jgi:hypothetical protein
MPSGTASERWITNAQTEQLRGTGRDMTVPPTVLLIELDNGTLILQGRPDGLRAYLNPAEAIPLRRELTAAFRCTELGPRDDQDDAW